RRKWPENNRISETFWNFGWHREADRLKTLAFKPQSTHQCPDDSKKCASLLVYSRKNNDTARHRVVRLPSNHRHRTIRNNGRRPVPVMDTRQMGCKCLLPLVCGV